MAQGQVLLSLIWLALNYLRVPFEKFADNLVYEKFELLSEHQENFIAQIAAKILLRVKGKVEQHNKEQGFNQKMHSSKILETCNAYISNTWRKALFVIENSIDMFSALVMFGGLILASTVEINHTVIFIIILVMATISETLFSNKMFSAKNATRSSVREATHVRNEQKQNLINLEPICNEHADYMVGNYITANNNLFALRRKSFKLVNRVRVCASFSSVFFTLSILALKIWEVGFENIDMLTIVGAISLVNVYAQFTNRITSFIHIRDSWREICEELKINEPDFENILSVYTNQTDKDEFEASSLLGISIPLFKVQYAATEGTKPFTLVSDAEINIRKGDFVVLTGTSGSGKTTLMKLITQKLQFDSFSLEFNTTHGRNVKSIFHQDRTMLGSNSVLNEITFGRTDFDREKLLRILTGLHITQEFSEKTDDIIYFLSHTGNDQFSAGQMQRLALARTLMNLDESIHIIAFDEATNNLNDNIALMVINLIKELCQDKIVLFATHQTSITKNIASVALNFKRSDVDMSYHVSVI